MKYLIIAFLTLSILSCKEDPIPKPKAYLRLEYPQANYKAYDANMPFTFNKNSFSEKVTTKALGKDGAYGVTIEYPKLKGTIYLTYKPIDGKERLITYLKDAQNFTQKHTQKADEIIENVYENSERKVYGMFYEVGGNAASQSQFYVTDSTKHFLTGSLYFYTKPNYDSILPAANYLQNDIKQLMESIEWK